MLRNLIHDNDSNSDDNDDNDISDDDDDDGDGEVQEGAAIEATHNTGMYHYNKYVS